MRALFLLLDPESNASSRHRVVQYLPYLRQHGVECATVPPVPTPWLSEAGERRGAAGKLAFYSTFFATRLAAIARSREWDVVAIQRDLFPFGPPLLERLLARVNPALLYDTDDATHIPPPFTPRTVFQRWRHFEKVAEVIRLSRQVTVATPALADYARTYNPNVTVIPMAVDWERYSAVAARRQSLSGGAPVTIGWTGTAGGFLYLQALAPVLAELAGLANVRYRFMSGAWRQLRLDGLAYEAVPWSEERELAVLAGLDVGIVPLADTAFERAKFPFKLLQYMALGIPPVCQRLGFAEELIEDGVNGFLAAEPAEWLDRLLALARDPNLRQRVGAAARETVRARFTVDRNAPLVLEALLKAAS